MPDRPEVDLRRWLRGGRPLKRWRWIGAFSEEVMLCAAQANIAGVPVSWWAIWDRQTKTMAERTRKGRAEVSVSAAAVALQAPPFSMRFEVRRGTAVETISLHGAEPIWTRKTPITVSGTLVLSGRRVELDGTPGLMDESAGHHARRTAWRWSAGVGTVTDGTPVTWNLVTGLHDDPRASERTVWIGDTPHHVPPQPFADDLTAVGRLSFNAESTRSHRENRLILASDYEQPFGSFSGALPVAGEVEGYGVMERHSARW